MSSVFDYFNISFILLPVKPNEISMALYCNQEYPTRLPESMPKAVIEYSSPREHQKVFLFTAMNPTHFRSKL